MKQPLFTGVCTALVTPFLEENINYPMLQRLLLRQRDAGIEAVVVAGTTGEAATLTDEEKLSLIEHAVTCVGDDILVIAGTGSNSTQHAVALSLAAQRLGADALLVVTPYYNRPTPTGLLAHYSAIASRVSIPIIVYNVPSRTGVDIPADLYPRLARLPNVVGVKEASPDITKIAKIRAVCPKEFSVWSGNDDMTVPVLSLGGQGVISVASNVEPVRMQAMARAALAGDFDTAAALQLGLLPLMQQLFCETNPVPVKEAMALIGYDCGPCRLPLAPLTEAHREALAEMLS